MKNSILIFAFILPAMAFATEYTTLRDGDWSNSVSVWSTDGTTECFCTPSVNAGDTISINHDIVQDVSLTLTNGTVLNINATGSVDGQAMVLNINDAFVIANGDLSSKKITIEENGSLDVSVAELYILSRLVVKGYLGIHFAQLNVHQGNVDIMESGVFDLTDGSMLHYDMGNFNNFGVTNLCNQCCIQLDAGNVKNAVVGIVNGGGSVISDNGNIQNDGSWDTSIKWCSAGSDFGMPSAEDCTSANNNCSPVPLPVEIVSFEGVPDDGFNSITWATISELNCDYYSLERSTDAIEWAEVARVNGSGTTNEETYYQVEDEVRTPQIYYYRLVQYDLNMDQFISEVISVESILKSGVTLYPNPSDGCFCLSIDEIEDGVKVSIFNMAGNVVYHNESVLESPLQFENLLDPGVYILTIDKKGEYETIRVIVR